MERKNEDDFGGTEKKVRRLLGELGIPRTGQGFSVVADAVVMALESEEVYGSLTKEIYPEIAKKRGKSAAAVEKAAREALQKGWTVGDRGRCREVFGDSYRPSKGRPTVGEFLTAAKDYLDFAA